MKKTLIALALFISILKLNATFADCGLLFQVPQNTWNANSGLMVSWTNWLSGAHGNITNSTPVSLPNGSEIDAEGLGCRVVPYNWANYQFIYCGTTNAPTVVSIGAWTVAQTYAVNIFCNCPYSGSHASVSPEGNGEPCGQ